LYITETNNFLLLRHCVLSPAQETQTQHKTTEMPLRISRRCAVLSCGKAQSLHGLPRDPNISKAWINFIFNEVPDRVNKTLFVCSLHFTADSFINKPQFDVGFSERLKIKDDAVPTILTPTVISQHTRVSNKTLLLFLFFIFTKRHYCFVTDRLI